LVIADFTAFEVETPWWDRSVHIITTVTSPQKIVGKKGKLCKIYEKIALKIDKIYTKVVCMLQGCGAQIWSGFCFYKKI